MINITSIESDTPDDVVTETDDMVLPAFIDRGMEPKPRKEKNADAEKPAKAKAEKAPKQTKTDDMIAMLKRAKGATGAEISEALGWLPHTTRAAVSTLPKKKQMPEGFTLSSEKDEKRGRVYRLVKQTAE